MIRFLLVILAMMAVVTPASAQAVDPGIFQTPLDGSVASWIVRTFGLLTVLSLAPGILIMITSFPRFIIAFSILRTGLGLPSAPANMILISLAMFMTFYVMAPTFDRAWDEGINPLIENQINEEQAIERISEPFRDFMLANTRPKDIDLFINLAREQEQSFQTDDKIDMRVLVPAFMISEIRRGFEIGFLVVLPFLVIDLVVASVLMSLGMMMLSPTIVSLPFKLLLFVLVDGWALLMGSLAMSFA